MCNLQEGSYNVRTFIQGSPKNNYTYRSLNHTNMLSADAYSAQATRHLYATLMTFLFNLHHKQMDGDVLGLLAYTFFDPITSQMASPLIL